MRSVPEIRQRLDAWVAARARFFPPLYVGRETMDRIIAEVRRAFEAFDGGTEAALRVRQQILELGNRPRADKPTQYVIESVVAELRWALGEEKRGAIRRVVWDVLVGQLHDAECEMRNEGPDLVLEGTACPYDPANSKRSFRFWVRFKEAKFDDDRHVWNPKERRFEDKLLSSVAGLDRVEKIWILYPDDSETEFALTAQDNTLSGILRFSGVDYDFRMWDHTAATA